MKVLPCMLYLPFLLISQLLTAQSVPIEKVIAKAESYLGRSHCLRSSNSDCLDCSKLTKISFTEVEIDLPRISRSQANFKGPKIYRLLDLRRGDLICFSWPGGEISHVGIVLENTVDDIRFIHTSLSKGVTTDWYNDWNNKIFRWGVRLIDGSGVNEPVVTDLPVPVQVSTVKQPLQTTTPIVGRQFPEGSERPLQQFEIEALSWFDRKVMKNEIYAKYGYEFHITGLMIKHFEKNQWYQSIPKKTTNAGRIYLEEMSDIERRNVDLLIKYESVR